MKIVETISANGYAIIFAIATIVSLIVVILLLKRQKQADDTMKKAEALLKQIDVKQHSDNQNISHLEGTIHQKDMKIEVLTSQIQELKEDKQQLKNSLQHTEVSKSENIHVIRQEYESKIETIKSSYELELKNYKQKVIDDNHELIQEQATLFGQEKSRNRIQEIQEFYEQKLQQIQQDFEQNHQAEIEKLAKEKAKDYLRNEFPFD